MALNRRAPIRRTGPPDRSAPIPRGKPLERSTAKLAPQSAKTRANTALRRQIVAEVKAAHPICERCQERPTVDVHECQSRARVPGSHLRRHRLAGLCRPCHDFVTTETLAAEAEGWLEPSNDQALVKVMPRRE